MNLQSKRFTLLGKSLCFAAFPLIVLGYLGAYVEWHGSVGCGGDMDPAMISRVVSLEGGHMERTALPLMGWTCTYQLTDGGEYVHGTDWGFTFIVFGGVICLVVGVGLLLAGLAAGARADD